MSHTLQPYQRLIRRWLDLTCPSQTVHVSKELAATLGFEPAGSAHVGASKTHEMFIFKCGKRLPHCAGCPRFQAYRQAFTAQEDGLDQGQVLASTAKVEADGRQRHGKTAEVDDLDADAMVSARRSDHVAHGNAHVHAIGAPRPPSVDHAEHRAEHRAEHSDGERHGLNDVGGHGGREHSSAIEGEQP
jgi:hypothetical protein